jgi:ribose transport system permease protein
MSTVNELFSNILPVFIGLIVGAFCGDTIGTVMGAVTLGLMSYGLTAVFSNELGASISLICTGVFVLLINICGAQGSRISHRFLSLFRKERE